MCCLDKIIMDKMALLFCDCVQAFQGNKLLKL